MNDDIKYTDIKIGIIGGDKRLCAVIDAAAQDGFECAVWGTAGCSCGVRCTSVEDAIRGSACIILPLPASQDGVRLFAPGSAEGGELRLARLAELIPKNTRVFGGRFPCEFFCALRDRGVPVTDYYEDEALKIKNAYQTAEGAVGLAINELQTTLLGSNVLVVGYGRVGKATAELLGRVGAKVTVAARKEVDLAQAVCRGFDVYDDTNGLDDVGDWFDAVFNTVPVRLITGKVLENLSGCLIIDLASAPFGEDADEAQDAGVRVIRAVSLPGKTSPISAGRAIYETVRDRMKKEGIIK